MKTLIQTATLMSETSDQYWMITAAAAISAGRVMAYWYLATMAHVSREFLSYCDVERRLRSSPVVPSERKADGGVDEAGGV